MERRSILKLTGLAGIPAAGAAPGIIKAQENLRWRLASSFPKTWTPFMAVAKYLHKRFENSARENSIFLYTPEVS